MDTPALYVQLFEVDQRTGDVSQWPEWAGWLSDFLGQNADSEDPASVIEGLATGRPVHFGGGSVPRSMLVALTVPWQIRLSCIQQGDHGWDVAADDEDPPSETSTCAACGQVLGGCEECDFTGWVVMTGEHDDVERIERDDVCKFYPDDESAQAAAAMAGVKINSSIAKRLRGEK